MKKKIIILLSVLGAAVLLLASAPFLADMFGWNGDETAQLTFDIEKQDFAYQVSDKLETGGIIRSQNFFRFYMYIFHNDYVYKNGKYHVDGSMSYREIYDALEHPLEVYTYVTVTVPEGKTAAEIGIILEENGICSADAFYTALSLDDYDFPYLSQTASGTRPYRLEGYLFPATYEFMQGQSAESVVQEMLNAFSQRIGGELEAGAQEMGLSVNELITFASIIQAEALGEASMYNISSVFWNRLNSPGTFPQLQSDPTISYANTLKEFNVSQDTLDAYNTYQCTGLPVGPINSPGEAAIQAVLNPNETDYYFFLSDADGVFYYAETLAEHQANIQEAGI